MADEGEPLVGRGRPVVGATYEELLESFLIVTAATDGIVVDKARAEDPEVPCHLTSITTSKGTTEQIGFKAGIIGSLSQDQIRQLCQRVEPMKGEEAFKQHIQRFVDASTECVAQGANSLETRIACMGTKLHRGD